MRRLKEEDLSKVLGTTVKGYHIEAAKIKQGPFIDSDHYGVALGKNPRGEYVTWEFHLMQDESVSMYWGHFMADREDALRDFHTRSMGTPPLQWFDVTITETLALTVRVEAHSQQEAKQIVSDDWKKQEYVLGPEHFSGVEFEVKQAERVDRQE